MSELLHLIRVLGRVVNRADLAAVLVDGSLLLSHVQFHFLILRLFFVNISGNSHFRWQDDIK